MKHDDAGAVRAAPQRICRTGDLLRVLVGRCLVDRPLNLAEDSEREHSLTVMATEHFDRILEMLDSPDKPMPHLAWELNVTVLSHALSESDIRAMPWGASI
jgi:hypothetical protein